MLTSAFNLKNIAFLDEKKEKKTRKITNLKNVDSN